MQHIAQSEGLELAYPISFNVDGQDVSKVTFDIYNANGTVAANIIMYLQSASVDNAKFGYLAQLNINPYTMGVAALIGSHFDENHVGYFLAQPVLWEYVKILGSINDLTKDTAYNPNELSVWKLQKIRACYSVLWNFSVV